MIWSRAPYGARGLKCQNSMIAIIAIMSRPVWGAWIEMLKEVISWPLCLRRAPYGARGLKYFFSQTFDIDKKVAPRMGRVD